MTPQAQCALHAERVATSVCVRCGAFTCAECNPSGTGTCPPCQQLTGSDQAYQPPPWEKRDQLGFVQAVWLTWKSSIMTPNAFFRRLDPNGPTKDAFLYGWLLSSAGGLLQIPFLILNLLQTRTQLSELMRTMNDLPAPVKAVFELFNLSPLVLALTIGASAIVLFPLSVLFSTALAHLGVRMVGGTSQPFGTTLRVLCYAIAPNVLTGVPVIGGFVAFYTLALEVIGLREAHRITVGRAIVAVAWPVVLFCCCGLGGAVLFGAGLASVLAK